MDLVAARSGRTAGEAVLGQGRTLQALQTTPSTSCGRCGLCGCCGRPGALGVDGLCRARSTTDRGAPPGQDLGYGGRG
jgi:hypothetical protein